MFSLETELLLWLPHSKQQHWGSALRALLLISEFWSAGDGFWTQSFSSKPQSTEPKLPTMNSFEGKQLSAHRHQESSLQALLCSTSLSRLLHSPASSLGSAGPTLCSCQLWLCKHHRSAPARKLETASKGFQQAGH